MSTRFFPEFVPPTYQEWMDKVTADLKGADFQKKMVWRCNEGFEVQPMYRLDDLKPLKNTDAIPGSFPYLRGNQTDGNHWFVRQDISVECPVDANTKALDILSRGVSSLGFVIKDGDAFSEKDMEKLLCDIEIPAVEINFTVCRNKLHVLKLFLGEVKRRGFDPHNIWGGINIDPLMHLLRKGKLCKNNSKEMLLEAIQAVKEFPHFKAIEIGGFRFGNAGSTLTQESAFSLSIAAYYLDYLTEAGLKIEEVAPHIRFHLSIGGKYFLEIARLRAIRLLWAKMVEAYKPANLEFCKMYIHGETSLWNKTQYDPYVNLLRSQTEAMSAVLGGVESLTVKPFDAAYETPNDFSERIARNQQLLLAEESHFDKVADIPGGSYYIEMLTDSFNRSIWALFLETEEKGGAEKAINDGFIQITVQNSAAARLKEVSSKRELLLGTNEFPNFNEHLDRFDAPQSQCLCHDTEAPKINTLQNRRAAEAFEALRKKTDEYALTHRRPLVVMFPMGDAAMRSARAQFSCNFFACAGFEVRDHKGFASIEEGVAEMETIRPDIVVVCSSDAEYETIAPEVFKALHDKMTVVVAGNPECRPALEALGLTRFIHVRNNLLEELTAYQQQLGI